MNRISLKAVLLAGILDIVLTNVLAFPIAIAAAVKSGAWKLSEAQQTAAVMDAMVHNTGLYVGGLLLGSLASVVAGYVAARIARKEALLNGAFSAWLCVASAVYAMFQAHSPIPIWMHLAFLPLSPALGAVGGHVWQLRASRGSSDGPTPVVA